MLGSTLGQLAINIVGDLREIEQSFDKTIKLTDTLGKDLQNAGKSMSNVGRKMTMGITLPAIAAGAGILKIGADFDQAMTESLAIINGVTPEIRSQMEYTARQVATSSKFGATQAAESYFYLASAGLDAVSSMEALPKVAQFAQAGNFDMARATDLLTDAQSALGMTIRDDVVANMENMIQISDVLVKANTLANATVEQFSESLTNKAGAAIRDLGKDLEEGVAVLAVFADQGLKGAAAGEALTIVFRDLQSASIKNREEWDELGIKVYDSAGNMRHTADIIDDLTVLISGMSDEQKRLTLMTLGFQDRSVKNIQALMGTTDAMRDYEEGLRNAGGITEEIADKQMESLSNKLGLLKDKAFDLALQLFDSLAPTLNEVVIPAFTGLLESLEPVIEDIAEALPVIIEQLVPVLVDLGTTVGDLLQKFADLNPETQQAILKFGGIVIAAGPALMIMGQMLQMVGGLTIATKGLVPMLAKIGAATGLTSLSTGLLAGGAMAGIGYGGVKLADQIDNEYARVAVESILPHAGLVGKTRELVTVIKELSDGTAEWTSFLGLNSMEVRKWEKAVREGNDELATEILEKGAGRVETAKEVFTGLGEWFKVDFVNFFKDAGTSISDTFSGIASGITEAWEGLKETTADIWEGVKEAITLKLEEIWQFMLDWIPFLNILVENWEAVEEHFSRIWTNISDFFSTVTNAIRTVNETVFNAIRNFLVERFTDIWARTMFIWNAISGYFSGVWEVIKTIFNIALNWISGIFFTITNFIDTHIIRPVWNGIVTFFSGIWDNIMTKIETFKSNFLIVWGAIKDGLREPINTMIGYINVFIGAIEGMVNRIAEAFNKIHIKTPDWLSYIMPGLAGKELKFNLPTVSLPRVPALALGGIIDRAGYVDVGERGRERIYLPRGAEVRPLEKDRNLSITNNFYSPKALDEREIERQESLRLRSLIAELGLGT